MKIVAYHRVSTARQGSSGLGLEAQESAIREFSEARNGEILASFTEIESGKTAERPELESALHLSKLTGATLLIAKLDRLSRNAAFLLTLRDSGVKFIAADMPDANDLTVGIMAVIAQQEREVISKRTKEALAAAKARGIKLGNPKGAAALRRAAKGNAAAVRSIKHLADRHAQNLAPVVHSLQSEGKRSLGSIADALNERGMLTPRGAKWYKSSVRNLLARLDELNKRTGWRFQATGFP